MLLAAAAGCGKDPTGNPGAGEQAPASGAAPQRAKAPEPPKGLLTEIEALPRVEPVPYAKLVELLPPAPKGFEAQKPRGENFAAGDNKYSFAERRYQGDHKLLVVSIQDAAHHPPLYLPFAIAQKLNREHTGGYEKGVTVDGNPGLEQYSENGMKGELLVLVGKRYIVKVVTNRMPPEFLRTVYGTIDTKKLAALQ
jgi:hypothetical protein